MFQTVALFAESSGSTLGTVGMIVMLVLMVAVFYFVGIRPQKKQEKQKEEDDCFYGNSDGVKSLKLSIAGLKSASVRQQKKIEKRKLPIFFKKL